MTQYPSGEGSRLDRAMQFQDWLNDQSRFAEAPIHDTYAIQHAINEVARLVGVAVERRRLRREDESLCELNRIANDLAVLSNDLAVIRERES